MTHTRFIQISHKWSLADFLHYYEKNQNPNSSTESLEFFNTSNSELKFSLEIESKYKDLKNDNQIAVIFRVTNWESFINIPLMKVKLSILDKKNEKQNTQVFDLSKNWNTKFIYQNLISIENLANSTDELMYNNQLSLFCEVR